MLRAIRQKTSVRLSGEQLAPQAQFSIAGPCVCFPSAAPGILLVGFASKTSSSSSLPELPSLVAGANVCVWTTSSDLSQQSGPFPRCRSRLTAHSPQRPSQPTCSNESFIFHSQPLLPQTYFPGSHHRCSHSSSPVQLCTTVLPSCCCWLSPL